MTAFLFLADEKGSDYPGSPRSQGEAMLLHLVYEFATSNKSAQSDACYAGAAGFSR